MTVLSFADGIRCDVCGLLLNDAIEETWKEELDYWGYKRPENEFWEYALAEVKLKYPNAILLAEVYEPEQIEYLYKLGFTYTYNKDLFVKLHKSSKELNAYIKSVEPEYWHHSAVFVENHDENRIVYNMGSTDKAMAAGTIAATIGGMTFLNHGQWSGYKNKLEVHLRRGYNEIEDEGVKKYYKKLMQIIQDPAFRGEKLKVVENMTGKKKDDFVAYIREKEESYYLVVVNYSDNFGCANVPISNLQGKGECSIREVINDREYLRIAENIRKEGLIICLIPWETQIFKYNY